MEHVHVNASRKPQSRSWCLMTKIEQNRPGHNLTERKYASISSTRSMALVPFRAFGYVHISSRTYLHLFLCLSGGWAVWCARLLLRSGAHFIFTPYASNCVCFAIGNNTTVSRHETFCTLLSVVKNPRSCSERRADGSGRVARTMPIWLKWIWRERKKLPARQQKKKRKKKVAHPLAKSSFPRRHKQHMRACRLPASRRLADFRSLHRLVDAARGRRQ